MQFITKNGNKTVEINEASFKTASDLKKIVMKNLQYAGIDIEEINGLNNENLLNKLIELLLRVDSSEEFENALFACLEGCLYDKFYKITPQLFDDIKEARQDFYEIAAACIEVNLKPFFVSLLSLLKQKLMKITEENTPEQQ